MTYRNNNEKRVLLDFILLIFSTFFVVVQIQSSREGCFVYMFSLLVQTIFYFDKVSDSQGRKVMRNILKINTINVCKNESSNTSSFQEVKCSLQRLNLFDNQFLRILGYLQNKPFRNIE